jgi:hypothetical protein
MKITAMLITALILIAAPIGGAIFLEMQEQESNEKIHPDTTPPVSTIDSPAFYLIPPLYDGIGGMGFEVTWDGHDNEGGVGISHFDVQYRKFPSDCYEGYDEGLIGVPLLSHWNDLVTNTTETSTIVGVHHEMVYEFRVRAADKAGNEEEWPALAQTRTAVVTIPAVIYDALILGKKIADEVEERGRELIPDSTPPVSRVLPLSPIAVPSPILTVDHQPRILMYPDIDLTDPSFAPEDDPFAYWTYDSIKIEWEGRDLKGSEDLVYEVQYRRVYRESAKVFITQPPIIRMTVKATEWTDWQTNVTYNEANFDIEEPGLYEFRCRATDKYGNVEDYPLTADAYTFVLPMI